MSVSQIPSTETTSLRSRAWRIPVLVLALLTVWIAYSPVLDFGLLGWDSYPLILSSRVLSAGDLLDSFAEELMDGLYPHAHYYRPIASLTVALDYALWGLAPLGYHASDLLVFAANALCLLALGRRHLSTAGAPLLAMLFFVHHPLQIEALPVTARRPDYLALLFTLLALLAATPRHAATSRARRAFAALCPALAISSKEAGALALPVVFAYHFLVLIEGTPLQRLSAAVRRCAAAAALVALALAARVAVLGGLGGPEPAPAGRAGPESWIGLLGLLPKVLVVPQPLFGAGWADGLLALGAYFLMAAGLGWARLRAPSDPAPPRSPAAFAGFLACWLAGALALPAVSGGFQWWYGIPALPPLALLVATLADSAWRSLRRAPRGEPALALAVALALFVLPLRYAPLVHDYEEWGALDAWQRVFLEQFRAGVLAAQPGSSLRVNGLPLKQEPRRAVAVQSAWGLSDYSVQAYAALVLPDRPVRVALGSGFLPADPSEIRVVVSPRAAARAPERTVPPPR